MGNAWQSPDGPIFFPSPPRRAESHDMPGKQLDQGPGEKAASKGSLPVAFTNPPCT